VENSDNQTSAVVERPIKKMLSYEKFMQQLENKVQLLTERPAINHRKLVSLTESPYHPIQE
jgi:hypothetical protein